jgi:hypothetical protein
MTSEVIDAGLRPIHYEIRPASGRLPRLWEIMAIFSSLAMRSWADLLAAAGSITSAAIAAGSEYLAPSRRISPTRLARGAVSGGRDVCLELI